MRIFLVEDNEKLGAALEKLLQIAGYHIDWVKLAEEALALFTVDQCDLLILDLGLPDGNGLNLLKSFRQRHPRIPVMILTAQGDPKDRVIGLDLGADDYLTKPFDVDEFEARVRALIRRQSMMSASRVVIGALEIDLVANRVFHEGVDIALSAREFELLRIFSMNSTKILSKEQIMSSLANLNEFISENAIEQTISRLRKKLSQYAIQIHSSRGLGYFIQVND